jgi:ParB/RepB/Spo0J family partition protein
MPKRSPVNRLKGFFKISPKEADALLKQLRSAWRHEDIVPQPGGYYLIPLNRIKLQKKPARRDLGDLEDLKQSIDRSGLHQPVVVTPLDERWKEFKLVIGLRRYHAFKGLGLDRIPCLIRPNVTETEIRAFALEENPHRKGLTSEEKYDLITYLRSEEYTIKQLAKMARTDKATILVYLNIPKFPREVQRAFMEGEISLAYLREMKGLKDAEMLELLRRIRAEHLSVDAVRGLVAILRGKLELPEFLKSKDIEKLLGSKLVFRRGKREIRLAFKASDEEELKKLLRQISNKVV